MVHFELKNFFRSLNRIFILAALISCAKPNYVTLKDIQQEPLSQQDCPFYFATEDLCMTFKWFIMPTQTTMGELELTFFDPQDKQILKDPQFTPHTFLWMPSMGHGSSPTHTTQKGLGLFRVKNVFFIMPGPWEMRYQLLESSKVKEERIYQITI